jgi:hypothetical protein
MWTNFDECSKPGTQLQRTNHFFTIMSGCLAPWCKGAWDFFGSQQYSSDLSIYPSTVKYTAHVQYHVCARHYC